MLCSTALFAYFPSVSSKFRYVKRLCEFKIHFHSLQYFEPFLYRLRFKFVRCQRGFIGILRDGDRERLACRRCRYSIAHGLLLRSGLRFGRRRCGLRAGRRLSERVSRTFRGFAPVERRRGRVCFHWRQQQRTVQFLDRCFR